MATNPKTNQPDTKKQPQKGTDKASLFKNIKETFFPSYPSTANGQPSAAELKSPMSSKPADQLSIEEKKKLLEAEKVYQDGLASVLDLIAPSAMEIKYNQIHVGGLYAQSYYVFAYPRYIEANWLSPIINFDVTMDISQFIYPTENASIMRILKKKVAQMQSTIRMQAAKGQVRDPAIETALEDAEELRTQLQRGEEKFFQFALYITLYSDDDKKLAKAGKQLESLLGSKLVLTKRADLRAERAFNSTLPLCVDELDVHRNMNTTPLSSTFPFSSSDLTSNEGILYGINRHNDSLIIFDRFKLENANSVIFATSGAGKSFAVKLEILRYMMLGTDVIVIDPENEYEALAETVGGSYLKISLNSDQRLNPFDLPRPIEGEETQPGDILRSNIITLVGLLKLMLGSLSPAEEGIIDRALIDTYALKGITMDTVDPSGMEVPTMMDLHNILSTMEGATELSQRLHKYTHGTYSGIFNQQSNVDIHSGLMVFCIRDLEDALRPTAMYIILNYIWSKIRSQLKRRLLVIDEAWSMMQHEDSAKFLFGLVKRARKYYLGITTITQDVDDFIASPYGKPIVTNSAMQLLLKQSPAAIDNIMKLFNLTEGERYLLLNSGVGQGLFFAGLKHVAIQIIASYSEDKLITTNPEEILAAQAEAAQFTIEENAESEENAEEPATEDTENENTNTEESKPEETTTDPITSENKAEETAPTTTQPNETEESISEETTQPATQPTESKEPNPEPQSESEIEQPNPEPETDSKVPESIENEILSDENVPAEIKEATKKISDAEKTEEAFKGLPDSTSAEEIKPPIENEKVEYGNELPMFRDQDPLDDTPKEPQKDNE